jgi:prepilin-type N-terminal cleavage/methylation domain-containing protein
MTQLIHKSQRGFSLIEVMFAMAIFAIGILAVAKMQLITSKSNRSAHQITQALLLVESQVERLKNVEDVTALDAIDGDTDNNIDALGNPGGIYTRTTHVTNPLGGSDTRRVEVSVEWTRQGRNRRVALSSLTQGNGL